MVVLGLHLVNILAIIALIDMYCFLRFMILIIFYFSIGGRTITHTWFYVLFFCQPRRWRYTFPLTKSANISYTQPYQQHLLILYTQTYKEHLRILYTQPYKLHSRKLYTQTYKQHSHIYIEIKSSLYIYYLLFNHAFNHICRSWENIQLHTTPHTSLSLHKTRQSNHIP